MKKKQHEDAANVWKLILLLLLSHYLVDHPSVETEGKNN